MSRIKRYRMPSPVIGDPLEEGMVEDPSGEWISWEEFSEVLKQAATLTKPDTNIRYYLAHVFGHDRIREFTEHLEKKK